MIEYQGMIMWLTGLPCSGKTTISQFIEKKLRSYGARTQILDGDQLRQLQYYKIGYSRNDRIRHIEVVAKTALMLKRQGIICIVAVIAPYERIRNEILNEIGAVEVYVDAPLEVCKKRDTKGMYAKAAKGEITNFTGVDDVYEPPSMPQIHLRTDQENPEQSCQRIYDFLVTRGYLDEIEAYLDSVYMPNSFEKILCKFPFSSLLLLKSTARKSLKQGMLCFVDDCMQFFRLKRYTYKHKIIFVAGLPKSGTTWLQKMLGMVPGSHVRPVYDPSRAPFFHNVSPMVFDLMPAYSYSIIKLHTKYTDYNFKTLVNKVGKFVVLYRDLRDMCISRYFHVLNQKDHRHNKLYHTLSQEDSLFHCMNIVKNEYIDWVQGWHEKAKNNSNILEIRYEDLNSNVSETMKSILAFFDIPTDEDFLRKIKETQLKKAVNLKESLAEGSTKRKGVVGDWKNYFNEDHKNYFKKIAGGLLISLRYEKDLNW